MRPSIRGCAASPASCCCWPRRRSRTRTASIFAGAFPLAPLDGAFAWQSRPAAPAIDAQTEGMAGDSPMLRAMMDNRAVLSCYEPPRLPGGVDPARPIVFAEGASRMSEIEFTPNRIRFDVLSGSGLPL